MNLEVPSIPFFASSNNKGSVAEIKSSRTPPNSKQNRHRKKNRRSRRGLLGFLFPKKSKAKSGASAKRLPRRRQGKGLSLLSRGEGTNGENAHQESTRRKKIGPTSASQLPPVVKNAGSASQSNQPRVNNLPDPKEPISLSLLPPPLAIATRLIVLTIGVSTLLGSLIAISYSLKTVEPVEKAIAIETVAPSDQQELEELFSMISLGNEIPALQDKFSTLTANYSQLEAGIYVVDLDNKNYVNLRGSNVFSAASTIKVPVLVAFFEDVDAGKIRLDEPLTVAKEVVGGGSGYMQYDKLGTKYSALHTATDMIRVSDNTATNMLIERMGGADVLNQRFADWGLNHTVIRNPLPDLTGTNTTSPEDLGNLLIKVNRGDLISLRSRDRLLEIMRKTRTRTLLPQGLEEDATIAHKTGDIRSSLGDVGIIDMPNGKRYVASVLVKRPANDPQAKILIQKISRTAYQHLKFYNDRPFISSSEEE
ncbi:MAG: serine hydrolase [Xenococcus sp. MO_188.B8]|nr:serine hydrolase [Xenococcus sp. MO_188.B8]